MPFRFLVCHVLLLWKVFFDYSPRCTRRLRAAVLETARTSNKPWPILGFYPHIPFSFVSHYGQRVSLTTCRAPLAVFLSRCFFFLRADSRDSMLPLLSAPPSLSLRRPTAPKAILPIRSAFKTRKGSPACRLFFLTVFLSGGAAFYKSARLRRWC